MSYFSSIAMIAPLTANAAIPITFHTSQAIVLSPVFPFFKHCLNHYIMPPPKENNGSPIFQYDAIHKLLEAVAGSEKISSHGFAVFSALLSPDCLGQIPSNIP
jgi:hypothetical protein